MILVILALFVGGALTLYALRVKDLKQGGIFAPLSREGALVLNNVLLTTACATVLIGTLYPLFLESITGEKISVGPPYFNATFIPLMVPLLLALPLGPMLAWKRGDLKGAIQRLYLAIAASLFVALIAVALMQRGPWLAYPAFALGLWVVFGALAEWAHRVKLFEAGRDEIYRRASNLPRAAYGGMFGHLGIGVMTLGIIATSAWQSEQVVVMKPGDTLAIAGYDLTFRGASPQRGPNYQETVGRIDVASRGRAITTLEPAKRLYDAPKQPTTEAGILNAWGGDLYTVLGDPQADGTGITVRVYFNPLVRFIWLGCLIMAFGGMLSLTDRRLRVGAPRKAAVKPQAAE